MKADFMETDLLKVDEKQIEPDWWFVAVDQTEDWHLASMTRVEKIRTVFLFDRNRHVHCCELTPSYECWPVGYEVYYKDEPTEQQRDAIEGDVNSMLGLEEVAYYHVGYIERHMTSAGVPSAVEVLEASGKHFGLTTQPFIFYHYGSSGVPLAETNDDREKAHEEQRREVEEWHSGNPPFA